MAELADAIEYIRLGNRDEGREILEELLEEDESNDMGWLWMSAVIEDDEERKICLENVVAINPDNAVAQRALKAIEDGSFDLNNMMSDALEDYEALAEDDDEDYDIDEDEDLEMPSTMKKKSGVNVRLIVLGVFIFVIVCGLGSAAVYNMFLAGPVDSTEPSGQPTAAQENAPTNEGEAPTSTPAPTDTPTITPTPTNTPFQLPTQIPTEAPTPIPTQVVPPTSAP
jgi:tetratricopeptide (TPR) repeat protein